MEEARSESAAELSTDAGAHSSDDCNAQSHVSTHTVPLPWQLRSRSNDAPQQGAHLLAPNTLLKSKELGLLGEMAGSTLSTEHLAASESKEVLRKMPTRMGVFRDTHTPWKSPKDQI